MNGPASYSSDEQLQILVALLGNTDSYHNHKENQAYAAFAAYIAIMGGASLLSPWPPKIFENQAADTFLTLFGLLIIFFLSYFFIRWQLENRRYAAVRNTGIYNVLLHALANSFPPQSPDSYVSPPIKGWWRVPHFFFPLRGFAIKIDETKDVPSTLAEQWKGLETGDNGIFHERIIVLVMWALICVPVARWFYHLRMI
jgi:hypothetical protein